MSRTLAILLGGLAVVAVVALKDFADSDRFASADQAGRIASETIAHSLPQDAGVHSVVTTREEVMIWISSPYEFDVEKLCPDAGWWGWGELDGRSIWIEGAGPPAHCPPTG